MSINPLCIAPELLIEIEFAVEFWQEYDINAVC